MTDRLKFLSLVLFGVITAGLADAQPIAFEARLLSVHNAERTRMAVPPLEWSTALSRDAAVWAAMLAKSGQFDHDPQRGVAAPQGENLWMGTKGSFSPEEMVQSWIDEKTSYRRGVFPNVSRTGNWSDVGHYTQIIWRDTKQVGCAQASGAEGDYLVCRYFPSGNWMGSDPEGNRKLQFVTKPKKRNYLTGKKR
jgi:hypothetical protein